MCPTWFQTPNVSGIVSLLLSWHTTLLGVLFNKFFVRLFMDHWFAFACIPRHTSAYELLMKQSRRVTRVSPATRGD